MKLLLISLQSNAYITGLKYIAASAVSNGHEVRILFLPGYLEKELHPEIKKFINDYSPDLAGIGLMSIEFYPAKNLTMLLKQEYDFPVIWGGVHAIIRPDECVQYADYVCTGEGESVIVPLLEHLKFHGEDDLPEIPGIWINHKGKIEKRALASPVEILDNIPHQEYLPDYYYGFHNHKIYNFSRNEGIFRMYALYGGTCHMVVTTRGCPFKCSYCGNSAFMKVYGRKVRERSVGHVIEEIKREVEKNPFILYINFQDDCFFTHSREWIRTFCDEYNKSINLPFIVRVIPSMMKREKMFMLKEAGLCWIVMGIQSGSDRVNYEVYDRRIAFADVERAADIISETRAAPFYEMIVDNPYETDEERMETIDRMSSLRKPYIISLAHLTYFPGTPLAEQAVKDKIVEPDAYLYRYLLKIDETYFNKLLSITPDIPGSVVKYLNRPERLRRSNHYMILNILYVMVKRIFEPCVFFYITSRSLDYRISWIIRTVLGNWRSMMSRLTSKYLGRGDLEFGERMKIAKKDMPELFEK